MSSKACLFIMFFVLFVILVQGSMYNGRANFTSLAEEHAREQAEERRRRHKKRNNLKFAIPMIAAALLIKSVLFPLAFKAMAFMASISVILSTLSLIASSIVGYARVTATKTAAAVHYHPGYKKIDHFTRSDALLDQLTPDIEKYPRSIK